MEGIPFRNTDVPWTAGVGSDGEDLSSSGRFGSVYPSKVETEPSLSHLCLGDMDRGQGQGTRKISHIYGTPTMNQAAYT